MDTLGLSSTVASYMLTSYIIIKLRCLPLLAQYGLGHRTIDNCCQQALRAILNQES